MNRRPNNFSLDCFHSILHPCEELHFFSIPVAEHLQLKNRLWWAAGIRCWRLVAATIRRRWAPAQTYRGTRRLQTWKLWATATVLTIHLLISVWVCTSRPMKSCQGYFHWQNNYNFPGNFGAGKSGGSGGTSPGTRSSFGTWTNKPTTPTWQPPTAQNTNSPQHQPQAANMPDYRRDYFPPPPSEAYKGFGQFFIFVS